MEREEGEKDMKGSSGGERSGRRNPWRVVVMPLSGHKPRLPRPTYVTATRLSVLGN